MKFIFYGNNSDIRAVGDYRRHVGESTLDVGELSVGETTRTLKLLSLEALVLLT